MPCFVSLPRIGPVNSTYGEMTYENCWFLFIGNLSSHGADSRSVVALDFIDLHMPPSDMLTRLQFIVYDGRSPGDPVIAQKQRRSPDAPLLPPPFVSSGPYVLLRWQADPLPQYDRSWYLNGTGSIGFNVSVGFEEVSRDSPCTANCSGRGECMWGQCQCSSGWGLDCSRNVCYGSKRLTAKSGSLTNVVGPYEGPSTLHHVNPCTWLVQPDHLPGGVVTFKLTYWDPTFYMDAQDMVVRVYDGTTSAAPVLAHYNSINIVGTGVSRHRPFDFVAVV